MENKSIHLSHHGNVANNAFYNHLILKESTLFCSGGIRNFTRHAMSSPAWEFLDFTIPNYSFIDNPDWNLVEGASRIIQEFEINPLITSDNNYFEFADFTKMPDLIILARKLAAFLGVDGKGYGMHLYPSLVRLQRAFDAVFSKYSDLRSSNYVESNSLNDFLSLDIYYGTTSIDFVPKKMNKYVLLEHGTIRWITDGLKVHRKWRKSYQEAVKRASHVWVTNLDTKTIELVENLIPGKWSAFPHPYIPIGHLHVSPSISLRSQLRSLTKSNFVMLLPSSINWQSDHNKGSDKAIEAFIKLRQNGHDVGLVGFNWGRDLVKAKQILLEQGVIEHVYFLDPIPRLRLFDYIRAADVILDQFGEPGFGALAIKVLDAGGILISIGITPEAISLIGVDVPWLKAKSSDEIVQKIVFCMNLSEVDTVRMIEYGRMWLKNYHSPKHNLELQKECYLPLTRGNLDDGIIDKYSWRTMNMHNGGS